MSSEIELDPRIARTRERVLAATGRLLVERGFERITIEAIADQTGIARSTIYRNWPDRAELYIEAFDRICAFSPVPDLGSLADELAILARDLADGLTNAEWGHALPSLIGAAAHDDDLGRAHQAFSESRRAIVADVFARAATRGELSGTFSPQVLAETFAAGFFYHGVIARLALDDDYVRRQLDIVLTLASA